MSEKLFIKAVDVIVLITMTGLCLNSEVPKETIEYEKPVPEPVIVETIPIQPDIVTLLREEVRYTKNWDEGCEDHTIQLSYEDAQLLMQIASAEAKNQGVEGMLKIMETIINRTRSDKFPDTVLEVVSEPGQFPTFSSGAYLKAEITPEVHQALAELEKNKSHDDNVVAFETESNGYSLLSYFDFYMQYKDHIFYKNKKD
ncbi:MAG: cell wall hydrolase [Paludibacteraceae bacterium]|nr:cell wall hydrolase [Paludibacteraceae bacterium]